MIVEKYISNKIKYLISLGKTIIICSHSSILNTITIPISVIYTKWENNNYLKYQGDLLSNKLINISDKNDILTWTNNIIEILEGGEEIYNFKKEIYEKFN